MSTSYATCSKCGRQIGSVSYITADQKIYHPECSAAVAPTAPNIDALIERLKDHYRTNSGLPSEIAEDIASAATALQCIRDERDRYLVGMKMDGNAYLAARDRAEAAEARIKALENALHILLDELKGD